MRNQGAFRHSIVALGMLLLAGGLADAQQPQPPRDRPPALTVGTGAIKGHVIDGTTGLPLARARVRLQGAIQRPGQRFSDVQVVFTDRRTELTLGIAGEDGQPTRDYVAIVFSTDKERWSQPFRFLRTYVPPTDEQIMTNRS